MSTLDLATLFSSSLSASKNTTSATSAYANSASTGGDFASSLSMRMAEFETQAMSQLFGASDDNKQSTSIFDLLAGTQNSSSGASDVLSLLNGSASSVSQSTGLSASGLNTSLADPQSAYNMMSLINTKEVDYKAQYAELRAMKNAVSGLEASAATLGSLSSSSDNAAIVAQLQTFTADYNAWIQRFDATVQNNGVLAGTQAAEVSLHELEQSVENNFNGATSGFHGLDDLGLSIDETSNLATLDVTALNSALASNKNGVVNTLQEFAGHFGKSAELLTSSDNFIDNRLDNLDGVIGYIDANKSSLQSEFGRGDAAHPSAQVAQALATYDKVYRS